MKYRLLPLVISIFLALVPFLWLKSGYLDLGGDSSRLYFFDPLNYLKSFPLWGIAPDGLGAANISYSLIPFVLTLLLFKQILHSPYLLITLFNSVQLVVSFLSVYLITIEFLRIGKKNNEIASIYFAASIAGLFYILSPFLSPNGWDKAMFIHNQLFLNPLIFFIVLKYIHSIKIQYLLFILIITFIFAPNFSPSPSVFAFYPLAFSYLLLYAIKIRKIRIPLNHVFFMLFLFLSVHLFHLAPFINNVLFVDTSVFHQATFSEEGRLSRGLGYFLSVAQATKFTNNLLSLPQGESSVTKGLDFLWIIFPMILTISLVLHKRFNAENKSRVLNFLLLFVFFLIVLFLITGNFTEIGLSIYKSLFYIPGFAMFRNYVGQFAFVFIFFYAILLGQSLFYLLLSLKSRQKWIIYSLLLLVITISSLPFIKGDMINLVLNRDGKTKVRVPIKMDPVYEEVLIYIRENKIDGKYLTLPLTEAGLQILAGKEGGAYLGPSTIAYLAGKKDFSGYQVLSPFSDLFLHLVKNKNYESLNNLLALLNIKYIFYNSDSYIYGENFPNLPYQHVNKFMPKNQKLYREFIENLAVKKIRSFGNKYHLYEVKNEGYLPHIHIAKSNLKVTINDIGHAFDFYPIISEPTVIATSIATPRVGNESNTQNDNFLLESNKVDIYKRISKSFPIPVRYPFARWNPESIVYPLLIIKEKRQQESFKNLGDSYIDSKLFFSAKRISEIARWEGGYRVSKDIRNSRDLVNYFPRDIKSQIINWFGRYTSWEVALSRYFQGIEEAINFIERSKTSRAQKIERKSKVHQSIVDNQIVLNTIINRSETLKENKTYLLQLLDELFDYYLQQVKQDEFNPSRIEYSIDNKIGNNIPFEVYIKKSTLGGADMKNVTLEILNSKLRPKEISPKDSLIQDHQPLVL